jgi:hypothetical protein
MPKSVLKRVILDNMFGLTVGMGRFTPSFRQLLLAEIERLYKRFRPRLRDTRLQEAFDALTKIWGVDAPAMMQSNISVPLDTMNLMANVHTKAELERLDAELKKLRDQASRAQKGEKVS